eukprot:3112945-Amphidinium_carterae.2
MTASMQKFPREPPPYAEVGPDNTESEHREDGCYTTAAIVTLRTLLHSNVKDREVWGFGPVVRHQFMFFLKKATYRLPDYNFMLHWFVCFKNRKGDVKNWVRFAAMDGLSRLLHRCMSYMGYLPLDNLWGDYCTSGLKCIGWPVS